MVHTGPCTTTSCELVFIPFVLLALQQYRTLDEPLAEWGILVVPWLHEIEYKQ
jgi:hypothetical protein